MLTLRNIRYALRRWALTLLAGLTLHSCADDAAPGDPAAQAIAFSPSFGGKPMSRAASAGGSAESVATRRIGGRDSLYLHTAVYSREAEQPSTSRAKPVEEMTEYGSFSVYAYVYAGAWDDAEPSGISLYMDNVKVTESGDGYWSPSAPYYWQPKGRNIRFFAYAPFGAATFDSGSRTLSYHVPDGAERQHDLAAACSDEYEGGAAISAAALKFRHLLTAVRFTVGDNMAAGKVSRITLSGVYGNGTYDLDASSWTATGMHNFAYSQNLDKHLDGTPGTEITSGAATFMMLPQQLPDGAKIVVEFTDDISGVKNTIDADIAGTVWEQGKIVEYRLSTTSIEIVPTFKVEVANNRFTYKGGSSTVKVTSYADFRNDGTSYHTRPMPWTAKFYGYNETTKEYDKPLSSRPAWLTGIAESSEGSASASSYNFSVSAQSSYEVNESRTNLQNAPQKGTSSSPYNLATKGGSRSINTANCYVVDAPGYYCFPLIYGNAIKNSQNNTGAYIVNGSAKFVCHNGTAINSPYITSYVSGTLTPQFGWSDLPVGVVSVTGSTQNYNLTIGGSTVSVPHVRFQINKSNLNSGNAVIFLKNSSGTIVWSWHIWITDRADESLTVGGKKMLPVLLGWSHDAMKRYDARSVKVVFTQSDTKATTEVIVTQNRFDAYVSGTCTYYQWGRKDALMGRNGNANITWYNNNNSAFTTIYTMSSSATKVWEKIYAMITDSWKFYNNPNTYPLVHHLWNLNNTAGYQFPASKGKTLYDPCPPGFRVPTSQDINSSLIGNKNLLYDDISSAWRYYTNNENKMTFFPLIGARLTDGSLQANGIQLRAWTSDTFNAGARLCGFTKDGVSLQSYNNASNDGASPNNGVAIIAIGE